MQKMNNKEKNKYIRPSVKAIYDMLSLEGKKRFLDKIENGLQDRMYINEELDSSGALFRSNLDSPKEDKLQTRLELNFNYGNITNMYFVATHELGHLLSNPDTVGDLLYNYEKDGKRQKGGVARSKKDRTSYGKALQESMINIGTKIAFARQSGKKAEDVTENNFLVDGEGSNKYIEFEKIAKMLIMLYSEADDYDSLDDLISQYGIDKVNNLFINSYTKSNGLIVEEKFNEYFNQEDMWEKLNRRLDDELKYLEKNNNEHSSTFDETFQITADVIKYAHNKKIERALHYGIIDMERKQELEEGFEDLYLNATGEKKLKTIVLTTEEQEI